MTTRENLYRVHDYEDDQPAISDEILSEMVKECVGDQDKILKKSQLYLEKNNFNILMARYAAEKGLLITHGFFEAVNRDNKETLLEIEKIIEAATCLQKLLTAIPDFNDISTIPGRSLAMRLSDQLYAVDEIKDISTDYWDESPQKAYDWNSFLYSLNYYISIFQKIEKTLVYVKKGGVKKDGTLKKKKGRPKTTNLLSIYIQIIAELYTEATGEDFTAEYYRQAGKPVPISEGQRFASKAMMVFNTPTRNHLPYKSFFLSHRHTEEAFQNACSYVAHRFEKPKKKPVGKKIRRK
jgi:hypothetical protein